MTADDNLRIINPVEGLQNVAGLTPAKRLEQKKQPGNFQEQKKDQSQEEPAEVADEENSDQQNSQDESAQSCQRRHIDYRA